jgi:hypothetical protein
MRGPGNPLGVGMYTSINFSRGTRQLTIAHVCPLLVALLHLLEYCTPLQ